MYLSQVILKVHDSYDQHQLIWSLFPDVPDRKRDHLFRVEESSPKICKVLLQSTTQPIGNDKVQVLAVKSFIPRLAQDAYYKFKLLACPTKRNSQSKKLIEIENEDERVSWLQRKLVGANVTVTAMDNKLVSSSKAHNSRFVCYEGVLQVIDVEQMERALVMGIGRKKHAGAGLLSLARTK